MAGSASNYLEDAILDHILGGGDFTRPGTVYIALWTSALDDTSDGATSGEVSGGSYARVAVTNNATNFPAASSGAKSNGTTITFPTATAGWGTVTYVAILDSATLGAGNVLFWADLAASKTVNNGDTASFAVDALSFTAS